MKYFLDTEFLEGTQKTFLGKTKPTIDLISIGLVCENGDKYYAISKDFNIKEAWNRYDLVSMSNKGGIGDTPIQKKVYWIRENVLKPIFEDWKAERILLSDRPEFDYINFKYCIKTIGKTNKQIADEVQEFVNVNKMRSLDVQRSNPEFYGYFCDYDWIVFCWLFGNMNALPSGYPMYCVDLKQEMDRIAEFWRVEKEKIGETYSFEHCLNILKQFKQYPKQTNEHNALSDAMWNFELFKFLQFVIQIKNEY